MSFTTDVGPRRSSKDVDRDRLTPLTEHKVSIRATPGGGYWAAYYINRDGGWSVACDALGRIIRCETEKLALSVARYRRRRLRPFRVRSRNLACTKKRDGRIGVGHALVLPRSSRGRLGLASGPSSFQTPRRGSLGRLTRVTHPSYRMLRRAGDEGATIEHRGSKKIEEWR